MLKVQQLFSLHSLVDVDIVPSQVVCVGVDSLGEDADCAILLKTVDANSSQVGASILDEGNGNAETNEAYFFKASWLH